MLNVDKTRGCTPLIGVRGDLKTSEMSQDELVRVTTAAASIYSYKNSNVEKILSSIGPSASLKLNLPKLL